MLLCADDSYYVGSTFDLERRLAQHQDGQGATYTRTRRPVRVVWCAEFASVRDAYVFEKQVQGWGRAKREALVEGRYDLLPVLASRCWSDRRAVAEGELPTRAGQPQPRSTMPWDVPFEVVHDPDDPWAPLRTVEGRAGAAVEWSRDGC
ncbi:MAG: excinuclease subunit [Nocardioides sp.]|jgi:putative endonuclease|nr:excinuclease subunit [Nocardioides sp.]